MAGNTGTPMQQPQQTPVSPHPDLVAQVRVLVQQLKESLSNLMRISSANINHNAQIDTGSKTVEGKFKFDKALEDFFALTNQIERHLRTIAECVVQQKQSLKYMPFGVSNKLDASGPVEISNEMPAISYNQYINIMKTQTTFVKAIQDILNEGAQKISHNEFPATAAPTTQTSTS